MCRSGFGDERIEDSWGRVGDVLEIKTGLFPSITTRGSVFYLVLSNPFAT